MCNSQSPQVSAGSDDVDYGGRFEFDDVDMEAVEAERLAEEQEAKARETAAELKRERFMIAEARRVFDSLDNNHDGQLSTAEVLNGKHAFVCGTVY